MSQDDDEECGDTSEAKGAEWHTLSKFVRISLGMGSTDEPWTPTHQLTGVPRHPRHKDTIQCAYGAYVEWCSKNKEEVSSNPNGCIDLTQQVDRRAWGPEPRCFSKGSLVYCFAMDRVLTPEERDNQNPKPSQLSQCAKQQVVGRLIDSLCEILRIGCCGFGFCFLLPGSIQVDGVAADVGLSGHLPDRESQLDR